MVYVPPVATAGLEHAAALRSAAADARIPVLTTFLAVEGLPDQLALVGEDGVAGRGSVPSYASPERAVAALAHAARYAAWQAAPAGEIPVLTGLDRDAGRALVDDLRAGGPAERELTDDELRRLLSCYGIHITDFRVASSESEAVAAANAIGYPVALKTLDEALRHREDRIGVRLTYRTRPRWPPATVTWPLPPA